MAIARSREEFIDMFSERMTKASERLKEGRRFDVEQNLPKTYLIEAHRFREHPSHGAVLDFLRAALDVSRRPILETKDEFFFAVKLDNVVLYIDALESRFWLAHTLDRTIHADSSVEGLVKQCPDLDAAWLPGTYLRGEKYDADNERLGVRFDPVGSRLQQQTERPIPIELQKPTCIEVEAPDLEFIWEVLLKEERIRRRMPIVRTILRREFEDGRYARIGLRYDGKMTARAPTYPEYIKLVTTIRAAYAELIRDIEDRYTLRWRGVDSSELNDSLAVAEFQGAPISIEFVRPPIDMGALISWIVHPNGPCRLWGHVERVSPDYYSIEGVDMHSGDPLGIELGAQERVAFIRLYLTERSCGNVVARLYTNIQQHVDPCAIAYGGDGVELFR